MALHSTLSCYIAVAFAVAAVYAAARLRGRRDAYTRSAILVGDGRRRGVGRPAAAQRRLPREVRLPDPAGEVRRDGGPVPDASGPRRCGSAAGPTPKPGDAMGDRDPRRPQLSGDARPWRRSAGAGPGPAAGLAERRADAPGVSGDGRLRHVAGGAVDLVLGRVLAPQGGCALESGVAPGASWSAARWASWRWKRAGW